MESLYKVIISLVFANVCACLQIQQEPSHTSNKLSHDCVHLMKFNYSIY